MWTCCLVLTVCQIAAAPESALARDARRVIYLEGQPVGHERTRFEVDGQSLRFERTLKVDARTFGGRLRIFATSLVRTDPGGRLLSFDVRTVAGPGRTLARRGNVEGNRLLLTTESGGRVTRSDVTWPAAARSPMWFEWQLHENPMAIRSRLRYEAFQPEQSEMIGTVTVRSGTWRKIELPDGTREKLLTLTLSDTRLPAESSRAFMDAAGRLVLVEIRHSGVVFQGQLAADGSGGLADSGDLDVRLAHLVQADRPLREGRAARKAVFRVSGAGNLETRLRHEPRQLVEAQTDGAVRVTVRAIEPVRSERHRRVDSMYLAATHLVDYRDQNVTRLAAEAAGRSTDNAEVALKLQQSVGRLLRNRVFSVQTPPASQIAAQREGDCTEHAVLLTAMLRARRIPARVATGLVYVDGQTGFTPHMWTEAMIDGEWTALDATFDGRRRPDGPATTPGAGYLQTGHSALRDEESVAHAFLPLTDLLDRVKIEVIRDSQ